MYKAENGLTIDLDYEPEVICEDITKLTNEQWKDTRRLGIGGSDVGVALGISKYKTPIDLYNDKRGVKPLFSIADGFEEPLEEPALEELRNRYLAEKCWWQLEAGHALEESVALLFYQKTGIQPIAVRKMFRHPTYKFLLADVDFFIYIKDEKGDVKMYILEIKTTSSYRPNAWGTDYNPMIPEGYLWQVTNYMAVTNASGAFICCKVLGDAPDSLIIRRVERDLEREAALIKTMSEFWERVQKGNPPAITDIADTAKYIEGYRKYHEPANEPVVYNFSGLTDTIVNGEDTYTIKEIIEMWQMEMAEKTKLNKRIKECDSNINMYKAMITEKIGYGNDIRCIVDLPDDMEGTIKCSGFVCEKIGKSDIEVLKAISPDTYEALKKMGVIKSETSYRLSLKVKAKRK